MVAVIVYGPGGCRSQEANEILAAGALEPAPQLILEAPMLHVDVQHGATRHLAGRLHLLAQPGRSQARVHLADRGGWSGTPRRRRDPLSGSDTPSSLQDSTTFARSQIDPGSSCMRAGWNMNCWSLPGSSGGRMMRSPSFAATEAIKRRGTNATRSVRAAMWSACR